MDNQKTIIAIKDAPIVESGGDSKQAYKIGDKFKVILNFEDVYVIWHPLVDSTMAVNRENFELLEEYRQKQISKII
jgi:hypothetical protein